MHRLGYLLITAGFLAGSYFAVVTGEGVAVGPLTLAILVGAVGVGLVRWHQHREATSEGTLTSNISAAKEALDGLILKIGELNRDKRATSLEEIRRRIDEAMPAEIDQFVQARQSISLSFGLHTYAEVMNAFAAGERYLNRVWSAATDGYIDEAHTHLVKALGQFELARKELDLGRKRSEAP
jgi:hypothetical protein